MNKSQEHWTPLRRFFKMLELDRKDITYIYVYAIFAGLITLSVPLGVQAIIGLIAGGATSSSLYVLIGIVTIGTALTGILTIMQLTVSETLQRRIFARSSFEFAYRIPRFKLESLRQEYPPELVNRFFDTLTIQKGLPKILMDFSSATLFFQKSRLVLSNFLWDENNVPLELTNKTVGEQLPTTTGVEIPKEVLTVQNNLQNWHPDLREYQLKLSSLEIERNLKAEKLKPTLNVEYNLLANGFDFQNNDKINRREENLGLLFQENFKWGLEFSVPLFLRKARGNIQLTDAKIANTNFKLSEKQQAIKNKIESYVQQLTFTQTQLLITVEMITNYQLLLSAENEKFRIGESSLFLVNSREQKLIEAQMKWAKLKASFQKMQIGLRHAAGVLK